MDRRNQPVEYWGKSLNFWCRLWQIQIEHSLRFWGAMAAKMPQPTAAELAAEADAVKASRASARRKTTPKAVAKPASKPAAKQEPASLH
ncbi:MAG: hypothetical protein JJU15_18050 [Pararhodobacter sp.]|nr:hypothetical protein [Pararhodobacter sp.]